MIWQRTVIFAAWVLVTAFLVAAWMRHSLETAFPRRLAEGYLWLVTLPLMGVGLAYASAGLGGFGAAGAVHLILTGASLRVLGRAAGRPVAPVRAAAALLILGSAVFWLGAVTWPGGELSSIAEKLDAHTATAALFLLGSLLTLAGFVGLRTVVRAAGEDWLSRLGLVGFQVGTAMWAIHLVFRITVVRPVAEQSASAPPPWFEPLHLWSGGLYAIYMVMGYLAVAAFGGALRKTRWVSRGWGRALVGFGLVAAVGFVSPASGAFQAPLIVQLAPYAIGILLLRRLIADERAPRTRP